jgi:hypothetical protein
MLLASSSYFGLPEFGFWESEMAPLSLVMADQPPPNRDGYLGYKSRSLHLPFPPRESQRLLWTSISCRVFHAQRLLHPVSSLHSAGYLLSPSAQNLNAVPFALTSTAPSVCLFGIPTRSCLRFEYPSKTHSRRSRMFSNGELKLTRH